jgi:hypothetical protein
LGVGGRAIVGFGKVLERHHQCDRLVGAVDRLYGELLPTLQLADQFLACLVIRHATVLETDHIGAGHWLALIDNDTRSKLKQHAEWQGDAQNLLGLAFWLNQHSCNNRLT